VKTRTKRGVTLVVVSLVTSSMLVMTCMAADVGLLMFHKTRMQSAADAGALAGAEGLWAGTSAAKSAAVDLAGQNGFTIATSKVTVAGDDVTVAWSQTDSLLVAKLLRVGSVNINVTATARKFVRRYGSRPFGLPDGPYNPGDRITVKQGTTGVESGNFQALALGGNGADIYLSGLKYGSAPAVQIGDVVPTETGNVNGPTQTGVDFVVDSGDPEIVVPLLKTGAYQNINGKKNVEVVGLAVFKLISANKGVVTAEFVRRMTDYEIPGSIFGSRLVD